MCNQRHQMDGETTWIQCCKSLCGKWRIVSEEVAIQFENQSWSCQMNTNVLFNNCSEPEEQIDVPRGKKLVLTKLPYKNGEVIMAKLSGHCSWPALICPDPTCDLYYDAILDDKEVEDEITHIHVEFFGYPKSHAWVTPNNIAPFCEINDSKINKKSYVVAMQEATNVLSLSCQERLQNCTFKTIEDISAIQKGSRSPGVKRKRNTAKINGISDEKVFLERYEQFLTDRNFSKVKAPIWCGKTISIHKIFQTVQNHGGYIEVTKERKWLALRDDLLENNDPLVKSSGNLKLFYERNMLIFENYWIKTKDIHGNKRTKRLKDVKPKIQNQLSSQSQEPISAVGTADNRNGRKIVLDLVPGGAMETRINPVGGAHLEKSTIQQFDLPTINISSDQTMQYYTRFQPSSPKFYPQSPHSTSAVKERTNNPRIEYMPTSNPSSPQLVPVEGDHVVDGSVTSVIYTKDSPQRKYSLSEIDNSQVNNDPYIFEQRLPMLYPVKSHQTCVKETNQLAMIDYVPSSNPSSPQFPIEEDLDEDCGMLIQKELREMESILDNHVTKEETEHTEHQDEPMKNNSHCKDVDVNNAIQEIIELEEEISHLEETTELDLL